MHNYSSAGVDIGWPVSWLCYISCALLPGLCSDEIVSWWIAIAGQAGGLRIAGPGGERDLHRRGRLCRRQREAGSGPPCTGRKLLRDSPK